MTSNACFNFPITSELHNKRLKQAIRIDILFLTTGAIAYFIVVCVETHAADAEIRGNIIRSVSMEGDGVNNYCKADTANDNCMFNHDEYDPIKLDVKRPHTTAILDAGFILTSPLQRYLSKHREVNNMLAMINSMLLTVPLVYIIYVTVWKGDFTLSFRLISTHLFRSLCEWFTYLPPDPEFLVSYYDFPEVFLCLFHHNCTSIAEVSSFFLWSYCSNCYHRQSFVHAKIYEAINNSPCLQLASSRKIVGNLRSLFVAVFVSDPAERLGLYYSRGISPALPQNAKETFEILVGVRVSDVRADSTVDKESKDQLQDTAELKLRHALNSGDLYNVQSETSVQVAVEIVSDLALNKSGSG